MSAVLVVALVACEGPDPSASSFAIPPGAGSAPGSTSEAPESTSTSTGPVHQVPEDSSTSSSSSSSSTGAVGTSEPLQDLGGGPDLGDLHPAGCKGKIDFLFVISRYYLMDHMQARLIEAFPHFIDTIESKFPDFDYHIMVVDGDEWWGSTQCNEDCTPDGCPYADYPCDAIATRTACDATMGAGTVLPAGYLASNQDCGIVGGNRYLTREQPDLPGTFACLAQIGLSGEDKLGDAVTSAVSPQLNDPGGCNAGFLRDDALLMITFVTTTPDLFSEGTPKQWAEQIAAAKHDDLDSVVMFGIAKPDCTPWDTICDLVKYFFPYWHMIDNAEPDYSEGFEVATDLVYQACSEFIPQ